MKDVCLDVVEETEKKDIETKIFKQKKKRMLDTTFMKVELII